MESLHQMMDELLSHAKDPALLAAREFLRDPPTLRSLGRDRGVSGEAVRRSVARDGSLLRSLLSKDRFRAVRQAAEQIRAEFGLVVPVESDVVQRRVRWHGAKRFEVVRWIAGYLYDGDRLVRGRGARADLKKAVDGVVKDEWLMRAEDLVDALAEVVRPEVVLSLLVESGAWREIGQGWLVRWDGRIEAKAERVLRLVGRPMTPAELVEAIGYGSDRTLKCQRGPALVRIDKQFRLALPEWGYEKYEGIANTVIRRVERGGGVASRAAIIAEFTSRFGVAESSIITYLGLSIFDVVGDCVRFATTPIFTPGPPSTVAGAVHTQSGWAERRVVTEDNLRGYSFTADADLAWANGIRPHDSLLVPLNGSPSHTVSVIWRTTNPAGYVEVGRARKWLVEHGVGPGAEILLCLTPQGVTMLVEEHEAAAPASSMCSEDQAA